MKLVARVCKGCGKPGGTIALARNYWHLHCFNKAKKGREMVKVVYIEAQDAFLFACNTSALYSHQCSMARQGKTLNVWINHVKWNVIRHYRNDVKIETVGDEWAISGATAKEVAALLKDYYEKHVKEG